MITEYNQKKRWWLLGVAMVVALVTVRIIASHVLFLYDDAFITVRYARNLIEGNGLVFNPGEKIFGLTTPLFGFVIAAIEAIHLSPIMMVDVLNIACDAAIMLTAGWLMIDAARKQGGNVISIAILSGAAIFGLLFITSPVLNRICVGGMEADLTLTVMLAAFVAQYKKKYAVAIVIASLAYFLRPEAVLLVLAFCIVTWLERGFVQAVKLGSLALLVVLPGLVWIYLYYGTIIPQSVIAKGSHGSFAASIIIEELMLSDPLCFAMLPFTLYGAVLAWRKGGILRIMTLWICLLIASYLIARAGVFKWYGEPVHVAECLFSGLAAGSLLTRWSAKSKHVLKTIGSPFSIAIPLVLIVAAWIGVFARSGESGVTKNLYPAFARWSREYDLGHHILFTGDIGVIGYTSNAYILDEFGLTCPEALNYDPPIKLALVHHADFLVLNIHRWQLEEFNAYHLLDLYKPIERMTATGDTSLAIDPDPSKYPLKGTLDFMLLKRITSDSATRAKLN